MKSIEESQLSHIDYLGSGSAFVLFCVLALDSVATYAEKENIITRWQTGCLYNINEVNFYFICSRIVICLNDLDDLGSRIARSARETPSPGLKNLGGTKSVEESQSSHRDGSGSRIARSARETPSPGLKNLGGTKSVEESQPSHRDDLGAASLVVRGRPLTMLVIVLR